MEILSEFFLPISIFFQGTASWLIAVFKGITFLGNTEFYLIVMPALFWCIDASLGMRTGILLLIGGGLNSLLKFSFQWPRPFWVSTQVTDLAEGVSFGFPSGHAQNAASLWGLIATSSTKKWFQWIAVLIIFLIGLSRIVIGVHFTHDVLVGWLIGALLLWIFLKVETRVADWLQSKSLTIQILALLAATSMFLIPAFLIVPPFAPPPVPLAWIEGAGAIIEPYHYDGLLTTTGSFFGLGLGLILLSRSGGYNADGSLGQKLLRYLIGLAGVLALYLGLGSLFPDNIDWISYTLRFLRYFLIGFWIAYGAPRLFGWLKIAQAPQSY